MKFRASGIGIRHPSDIARAHRRATAGCEARRLRGAVPERRQAGAAPSGTGVASGPSLP